jgi:hypothetical protein
MVVVADERRIADISSAFALRSIRSFINSLLKVLGYHKPSMSMGAFLFKANPASGANA